jgi:hypothetical protein
MNNPLFNPFPGMTAYGMSLVNGTAGLTPYGMELVHRTPQNLGPMGQQVELYNRRQVDANNNLYTYRSDRFDSWKY